MNNQKIKFIIASPERLVLSKEVDSLTLPTALGQITILPHHIPLISVLVPGEIRYVIDGVEEFFVVSSGVIEVKQNNEVSVLAQSAEFGHEIDLKRAEEARERAKKFMQEQYTDEKSSAEALASIEKHLARIRFVRKHRSRSKQVGTPESSN